MKDKIQPDRPAPMPSEEGSDTYLVDQVLQQARDKSSHTATTTVDLVEELNAMRAEVDRITKSVGLLAGGARAIVAGAPILLENELRSFAQRKPFAALMGTVALSFGLTVWFIGNGRRSQ